MAGWLLPLILAAAAGYLLWSYGFSHHAPAPVVEKPAPVAPAPVTTAPAPAAPAVDYAAMANKALGALTGALGGVTDEASAKAAVPAIEDSGKQVGALKLATAALSGDAKKPIASLVAAALPGITQAVEKAIGIPGVAAVLNPVVQPIVNNLQDIAK